MYNYITKVDFNNLISKRLGDVNKVYWTNSEINLYIDEALLTFGAVGQFYKDRLFLKTNVGENKYNLYTNVDNISTDENTLTSLDKIKLDKTYQNVLDLINISLMESLSVGSPTSELYLLDDVLKYIDKRLDLFLLKTGLNVDVYEQNIQATQIINQLPSNILDIIRVGFKDTNPNQIHFDKVFRLFKEDEGSLEGFDYNFNLTQNEHPKYYTKVLDSNNVIKVYYAANNGVLQVIGIISRVKSVAPLISTQLLLPPNLLPYIKYGVLADLLSEDGHGQDLYRAEYCKQRWEEGLIIGKGYTSILKAFSNDISINIESIEEADDFNNNWQNTLQENDDNGQPVGYPNTLILVGNNLIFLDKKPIVEYDISFDCVINANIGHEYIQIKEEYLNILTDYISHLAKFKEGFSEVKSSESSLQKFLELSLSHNTRLIKQGVTVESLMKLSKRQEETVSRGV